MSTAFLPLPTLVATVGDPGRTRIVVGSVAVLVLIGIGLALAAIWLLRSTRTDPEVLAPLELMGERRWRRSAPDAQQRRIAERRPPGATPLGRSVQAAGDDVEDEPGEVGEVGEAGPVGPVGDVGPGDDVGADAEAVAGAPVTEEPAESVGEPEHAGGSSVDEPGHADDAQVDATNTRSS